MNSRHKKTLAAILTKPAKSSIVFADVEALIKALGGEVRRERARGWFLSLPGIENTCTAHIRAKMPKNIR
jgi:hypothetical protein